MDLDPTRGVIRWAWAELRRHLKGVIVGLLAAPVAGALFSQFLSLPKKPSVGDRVSVAVVPVLLSLAVVALITFLYALIVAPYQQRNSLRSRLTEVRSAAEAEAPPFYYQTANFGTAIVDETRPLVKQVLVKIVFVNGGPETILFAVESIKLTVEGTVNDAELPPPLEKPLLPGTPKEITVGQSQAIDTAPLQIITGQFEYLVLYRAQSSQVRFQQHGTVEFGWPKRPDGTLDPSVNTVTVEMENERLETGAP